jgi:hypothetical protein
MPYNGGRGLNLVVTKSTTNETVPILGSRALIEITQDITLDPANVKTEISFVGKYSQAKSYGVIIAIQDHKNNMSKTVNMTKHNGTHVFSSALIRQLGTVDHNGNTYEYYLARVGANVSKNSKAKFTTLISTVILCKLHHRKPYRQTSVSLSQRL